MKPTTKPKKKSTTSKCDEYNIKLKTFGAVIDNHAEILNDHAEVVNSYAESWKQIRENQEVLSSRITLVFWFCGITTAIATTLAITSLVCK